MVDTTDLKSVDLILIVRVQVPPSPSDLTNSKRQTFIMCICINCRHIHNCITYKFISTQHQHKSQENKDHPGFFPTDTIISVNLGRKKNLIYTDWDLIECLSFIEKPGYWLNT